MSRERRREMVDREHPALSTLRQCALMGISRSSTTGPGPLPKRIWHS